ncbi:MAG TPA: FadD3 family acyl-CoA ligase [Acidimicrobiales bacterium]|nr:FadD3 family acyl-CoA ligase [Acidimicrobiales bacterium]
MTDAPAETDPEDPEDPRADLLYGTIPALVTAVAARYPSDEALVDGDRRVSFLDLEAEARRVTASALASGIAHGDRVGIWAPNIPEWVFAALGLLGAGAVLVPLNTRFKGPEAADILRRSGAKALFTVRGFLGTDYPRLLAEEDLPDLERIVLLRDDVGTFSEPTRTDEVPVFSFHEFLAAATGVVEAPGAHVGVPLGEHEVTAAWRAVSPSDLSDIIFTSGTTGRPKGAMTTHAQSLRTFGTWARVVGLSRGDRYLVVNPFFHTFGYKAGILACLLAGATIVPEPVFDVDRVLEKVAAEAITALPGPPTLYHSILDHPRRADLDLSSLRLAVTGAAAVPVELILRMRSELTFSTVLTAYGLTESTGVVTMCRRGDDPDVISHTSGRAIPDLEVKVVDDTGADLPAGQPGEVLVRGYTVVSGYYRDPDATADAIDPEGFLHTGDVGIMDDAGNLAITDRKKDMFIVGGFNAYPAEIEAALLGHPGVSQVAVVGIPDPRLGEVGCAFVVPRPDADPTALAEELPRWAKEKMANYKVPRRVVLTDALPLNASGKVLKTELRARLAATEAP